MLETFSAKYTLADETKRQPRHPGAWREDDFVILRQIVALRDIPRHGVKAGDRGGWIESEDNLAQEGDAWLFDNAVVSGRARIAGDVAVSGRARLSGNMSIDSGVFKAPAAASLPDGARERLAALVRRDLGLREFLAQTIAEVDPLVLCAVVPTRREDALIM